MEPLETFWHEDEDDGEWRHPGAIRIKGKVSFHCSLYYTSSDMVLVSQDKTSLLCNVVLFLAVFVALTLCIAAVIWFGSFMRD